MKLKRFKDILNEETYVEKYKPKPAFANWNGKSEEIPMGKVGKFDLVYCTYGAVMWGNGIHGTIRTAPESYYVATVALDGSLEWTDMEGNTADIRHNNKEEIEALYNKVRKTPDQKTAGI